MYPVTYEADYLRERNRLTTFFRPIVAIPWLIVSYIYGIAATVVVVIAWFAILILGRYPVGLYEFIGGLLRFSQRVNGFLLLQTDEWPSFGISNDPAYPIRVNFQPPAARQSRLKTLLRLFLLIPLYFVSLGIGLMQWGVVIISWLTIVFRGYQPAAIHNALSWMIGWSTRVSAYFMLMRDEYPPVGDETRVEVDPPAEPASIDAAATPAPEHLEPGTPEAQGIPQTHETPGYPDGGPSEPPTDPGSPPPGRLPPPGDPGTSPPR